MTIELPMMGSHEGSLVVTTLGDGTFTGTMVSPLGALSVENGRLHGNGRLSWTLTLENPTPMTVEVNATIDSKDDTIRGEATSWSLGSAAFRGTRANSAASRGSHKQKLVDLSTCSSSSPLFLDPLNGARRLVCTATPRFAVFAAASPLSVAAEAWVGTCSSDAKAQSASSGYHETSPSASHNRSRSSGSKGIAIIELDCAYTTSHIRAAFEQRRGGRSDRWEVREIGPESDDGTGDDSDATDGLRGMVVVQWREVGAMAWAAVLSGRTIGSSYCVRKARRINRRGVGALRRIRSGAGVVVKCAFG
jgi:hypothetical protein